MAKALGTFAVGPELEGAQLVRGAVGSVAGIYTASMPVFVVENAKGSPRARGPRCAQQPRPAPLLRSSPADRHSGPSRSKRHDGSCLLLGQDAKPDDESGVVVDQAYDPGLDVSVAEVDEEGSFEIHVPELVGTAPLIAGAGLARHRAAAATTGFEDWSMWSGLTR
jgi:hypothetical protein